ncbi:MAG: 50S ribosomal protein L33, partial [Patescibacteria group bacterium]
MVVKKKTSHKEKRPIIKLMCEGCKQHVYHSRKNHTNTPDRLVLKKYCKVCRKHTSFKET